MTRAQAKELYDEGARVARSCAQAKELIGRKQMVFEVRRGRLRHVSGQMRALFRKRLARQLKEAA